MSQPQYILFAGDDAWRLALRDAGETAWHELPAPATQDTALRAEQVSNLLRAIHYAGEPVLIALAASRCMVSTLSIDGLPKNDFKARLYRLESQLPMEAEQVIADFGPVGTIDQGDCVLAVCADRAWLSALVETLEQRQIAVGPIVPAALLAAQGLHHSKPPDELLLLGEPQSPSHPLDLLQIRAGRPVRWVTINPTVQDVHTQLEWQSFQMQPMGRVELLGVSPALSDGLGKLNGWQLNRQTANPAELAAAAGADVLLAYRKPLIDLRRGPLAIRDRWRLHRKQLNAALCAAVALMICLTIAFLWRGSRYGKRADQDQQAMAALFHATFPGWAMPANLKVVIESEHRKIINLPSNTGAGSTLATLRTVLNRLPSNANISMQKMTFTPQRFDLAGLLKNYEAADELASALRGHGLNSASPQARRLADGHWSFTLQGTVVAVAGGAP